VRGRLRNAVQGGGILRKIIKKLTASAATIGIFCSAVIGAADYLTPDSYTVVRGGDLSWDAGVFSFSKDGDSGVPASTESRYPQTYSAKLMLYHTIPIKTVAVNVVDDSCVILCGTPFGIKMFTNGVVVVGLADVKTATGNFNPAAEAGLKAGDIILSINGKTAGSNTDVEKAVEASGGKPVTMTLTRGGQKFSVAVRPLRSESDGLYKVGLWVRDSTAGIGTLTFYDPKENCFAGLGHGICDSDTGQLMPLLSGDIVPVTISGVTKGAKGSPGELRGYFTDDAAIGNLGANVENGVYGLMRKPIQGKAVKIAMKQDVQTGPAQICATIDGDSPAYYNVEIEKIDCRDGVESKNLVIRVTDEKLLAKTGGIVQGMSGSPILQNGKLVGAVTHVFVNDPTRGYGIFAENMLLESRAVATQESKLAS
jgi:stage IV sporulation protein B